MATIVPPPAVIARLVPGRDQKRIDQLEAEQLEREREDYRTVHTDRGPVRGWNG